MRFMLYRAGTDKPISVYFNTHPCCFWNPSNPLLSTDRQHRCKNRATIIIPNFLQKVNIFAQIISFQHIQFPAIIMLYFYVFRRKSVIFRVIFAKNVSQNSY